LGKSYYFATTVQSTAMSCRRTSSIKMVLHHLYEKLNFHKHCFSNVLAKVVQTVALRSSIGTFMVNVMKVPNPRQLFFFIVIVII